MALRSIKEITETYVNNISWEANNSLEEAKLFLAAAQELAVRRPRRGTVDGNEVDFDYVLIRQEINRARAFVNEQQKSTASNGVVRTYDTSDIRGY